MKQLYTENDICSGRTFMEVTLKNTNCLPSSESAPVLIRIKSTLKILFIAVFVFLSNWHVKADGVVYNGSSSATLSGTIYDLWEEYDPDFGCNVKHGYWEVNIPSGTVVNVSTVLEQSGNLTIKDQSNYYFYGTGSGTFKPVGNKVYVYFDINEWDENYYYLTSNFPVFYLTAEFQPLTTNDNLYLKNGNLYCDGVLKQINNYGYVKIGADQSGMAKIETDRGRFMFNKPVFSTEGKFGSSGTDMAFQPNGITRMTVLQSNGNVGVGTPTPAEKLDVNGNLVAGTTYRIKLMDFPGHASWIDMPVATGKATGIGSGGAGHDLWIGYAGNATQWFTNSSAGDICYRNTKGKLLFGNTDGNAAMAISGDKIGIGTSTPLYKLDVAGEVRATNQLIINGSGSDIGGSLSIINSAKTGAGQASAWNIYNMSGNYGNSLQFWAYDNIGCTTGGMCNSRFVLMDDGRVGIGTMPDSKLTIDGNFKVRNGNNEFSYNGAADLVLKYGDRGTGGRAMVHDAGNTLVLNFGGDFTGGTRLGNNILFKEGGNSYINSGNVGIGTDSPDELLTVKGTIHAREVKVDLTGPLADYVFSPTYKLRPLNEVEQFVKANSHLPEVPSAAEVKENGMNMGEMQNKLLQKVEELTLYVIEQQKMINQQNAEIKILKEGLKK